MPPTRAVKAPPIPGAKGPGWVMLGWQGWGSSSRQELGRKWDGSQVLDHLLSVPFRLRGEAASFKASSTFLAFGGAFNPLGTRSCEQARLGVRGMRRGLSRVLREQAPEEKAHCLLKGRCGGRHRGERGLFFFRQRKVIETGL